jgi:Uma2 family endonuclease
MGADALVPDLAGWRRERMPELPSVAAFDLAPDWICEVLSPSTSRIDRALKLPVYAREGVRHVWLVDPDAQTLDVLALSADAKWTIVSTFSRDDRVCAVPFAELDLDLALLWAR